MTLWEKRCDFTVCLARLIAGHGVGWDAPRIALDQVKRTQLEADANAAKGIGIKNSLHLLGLAADLLLYGPNGEYLTDIESYRPLGEAWEKMHPLARWGARFSKPDPGHFSFEHEGVR